MLKKDLISIIDKAWEEKDNNDISFVKEAVNKVLIMLDAGEIRVAEKDGDKWQVSTHQGH